MRRTTEDLDGKSGLNAARTLFQVSDVLLLGFADAAERRAEANTNAIPRLVARIVDARVLQRELCRHDCELSVTIEPFQAVRCKVVFGIPITNFARASHVEHARIEACDAANTTSFRQDSVPEILNTRTDARNRPDTCDDRASPAHTVTLSALVST